MNRQNLALFSWKRDFCKSCSCRQLCTIPFENMGSLEILSRDTGTIHSLLTDQGWESNFVVTQHQCSPRNQEWQFIEILILWFEHGGRKVDVNHCSAKPPMTKWDFKICCSCSEVWRGGMGGVTSVEKSPYSLVTSHVVLFLFLLFICGFPSSSPPPTSPAIVLSCSSVNV